MEMKIAHVLRKYDPREWGGTETAILQLLEGLLRHQVGAVVYAPAITGRTDDDPLAKAGVKVKPFNAFMPALGLSEQQKRQLVAVGGNLMSLDLIPLLWREPGVSLIHLHTLGRIGGVGRTVARRRGMPYVVTIHGGVLDLPREAKDKLLSMQNGGWEWGRVFGLMLGAKKVLRDAAAVLTLNPNEAAKLAARYPGKRIVVMPHGIPMPAYEADAKTAARDAFPEICGRRVLLVVGRIDAVKNQAYVVEQMPEILRRHPGVLLVCTGAVTDESYGAELECKIRELHVEDDVLLTGGLPPRDSRLVGLMQAAAAMIVPSISETFGLVIMEGWSAGAPVISSRTSGATQIIRDGENGFLFDLEEPKGLIDAVDAVLGNPEAAREMTGRGRGLVRQEFDNSAVTGRVKSLYEEVVREHAQCRR